MQTYESNNNYARRLQAILASVWGIDSRTEDVKDWVRTMAEALSRWIGRSYRIAVPEYCRGN